DYCRDVLGDAMACSSQPQTILGVCQWLRCESKIGTTNSRTFAIKSSQDENPTAATTTKTQTNKNFQTRFGVELYSNYSVVTNDAPRVTPKTIGIRAKCDETNNRPNHQQTATTQNSTKPQES